jgi:hypothetical protein
VLTAGWKQRSAGGIQSAVGRVYGNLGLAQKDVRRQERDEMEASEFKKVVEEAMKSLSNSDGPSSNTGIGFFIADMEELFSEWESEEHKCSF